MFHLALTLINEGDEVLIPAPYWVSYPDVVQFAGYQGDPAAPTAPDDYEARLRKSTLLEPVILIGSNFEKDLLHLATR